MSGARSEMQRGEDRKRSKRRDFGRGQSLKMMMAWRRYSLASTDGSLRLLLASAACKQHQGRRPNHWISSEPTQIEGHDDPKASRSPFSHRSIVPCSSDHLLHDDGGDLFGLRQPCMANEASMSDGEVCPGESELSTSVPPVISDDAR